MNTLWEDKETIVSCEQETCESMEEMVQAYCADKRILMLSGQIRGSNAQQRHAAINRALGASVTWLKALSEKRDSAVKSCAGYDILLLNPSGLGHIQWDNAVGFCRENDVAYVVLSQGNSATQIVRSIYDQLVLRQPVKEEPMGRNGVDLKSRFQNLEWLREQSVAGNPLAQKSIRKKVSLGQLPPSDLLLTKYADSVAMTVNVESPAPGRGDYDLTDYRKVDNTPPKNVPTGTVGNSVPDAIRALLPLREELLDRRRALLNDIKPCSDAYNDAVKSLMVEYEAALKRALQTYNEATSASGREQADIDDTLAAYDLLLARYGLDKEASDGQR